MKKILIALICIFMISTTTACNSKQANIVDSNGDVIHFSEEEITEGYYILKDDGFYYQILKTDTDTDNNGNVFTWFTEPYDAAIPRFTIKDKLLFYSETKRPSSITLYKMTDYGYTLGTMFEVTKNEGDLKYPSIIGFTDKYNPYSQIKGVVDGAKTENATTYIKGINNHEFTSSLLADNSFLKGLTKDTMYQLEFYCGTVRKTVNIKADTHLFLQESTYVASSYEELKSKCFEITLPLNIGPGYYYAEGIGLFYYEGVLDSIDADVDDVTLSGNNTESTEKIETTELQNTENTEDIEQSEEIIGDTDTTSSNVIENN